MDGVWGEVKEVAMVMSDMKVDGGVFTRMGHVEKESCGSGVDWSSVMGKVMVDCVWSVEW